MTHFWFPAELRGGALGIYRRGTGYFCEEVVFRQAEPSRCIENPTFFSLYSPFSSIFVLLSPLSRPLCDSISPMMFSFSAVCYDAATYSQPAAAHISNIIRTCYTLPCDFCCTPGTEHTVKTPRLTNGLPPPVYLGDWHLASVPRYVVVLRAPNLGGSHPGHDP